MHQVLKDLLVAGAEGAPALSAPGRQPLSFGGLRAQISQTLAALNGIGIGRNDRVAIVLPNGPEMASCFIACASGLASAPLNPAYRADEFEFYLANLNAKALIVEQGSERRTGLPKRRCGLDLRDRQTPSARRCWCSSRPGRRLVRNK